MLDATIPTCELPLSFLQAGAPGEHPAPLVHKSKVNEVFRLFAQHACSLVPGLKHMRYAPSTGKVRLGYLALFRALALASCSHWTFMTGLYSKILICCHEHYFHCISIYGLKRPKLLTSQSIGSLQQQMLVLRYLLHIPMRLCTCQAMLVTPHLI